MRNFAKYTARLAKASAAAERVLEVLEQEPEVRDLPGAREARGLRGAVRFEGVRFAYEPGHRVLEDVDFELAPRQRVALVGPSGSGKSTLVGFLLRLYDPGGGRILVDGRDLRDYTLASLRAHVSVVPQDTLLFATSVRENIACGAPGAGSGEIMNAARLANAHEFIRALPRGYDTVVGERGATLSNGQRQRIAVARAAIRRTPILILDEPVTGLDEENARRVGQALDRLARGRTTFLITHDLEHAAGSDLILFLEQGRVVERGTHKALLQANGRYAAMYRSQQVARQSFVPMEATHAFAR
jgi:ATP-binding cassette subfamily B protein